MHRPSFHVLFLSAFLQLGAAFQPAFGWNLCIGADGHSGIELAHATAECWNEVRRHHDDHGLGETHELAQHPCTDISLASARACRLPKPGLPVPQAVMCIVSFSPIQRVLGPLTPATISSNANTHNLSALRTVVLTL